MTTNAQLYEAADLAIRDIKSGDPEGVIAAWCAAIGRQADYARLSGKDLRSIINKAIWTHEALTRQVVRLHKVLVAMLDDVKS
jgi:hypothetical protein